MDGRNLVYFASDVHLGLEIGDPAEREARFVRFLRGIPAERTEALYLLGDVWDFWYEYRDVVPKGYVRVFAALMDLVEAGVQVLVFPGNHDMWMYSYLQSMGIKVVDQPLVISHSGKLFCLGHGDGLGPGLRSYKLMKAVFRNGPVRRLFSMLHPWIAFRLARSWSRGSRLSHKEKYIFKGEQEPLYQYAEAFLREKKVDYFIFGHYHCPVDMPLGNGARLLVLGDWIDSSDYLYFDGISVLTGHSIKTE